MKIIHRAGIFWTIIGVGILTNVNTKYSIMSGFIIVLIGGIMLILTDD